MAVIEAVPQHMRALNRANEIRLARAGVRREVRAGEMAAAEVIADPPECVGSMSVLELLVCQKRWGDTRARRLCTEVAVPEAKALGALTMAQRQRLVAALGAHDVAEALGARAVAERMARNLPCRRLVGDGGCLRAEGHSRSCVVAVHAPALGFVYLRNGVTGELLHSVEVALGGPRPSRDALVAMLARCEA